MAGRLHSGPEASFSPSPSSYPSSSSSPLSPDGRGGLTGESVNEEKEPITQAQLRINVISCWRSLERPRRLRPETNQDQREPFPFSHPLLLNLSPYFFPLSPPSFIRTCVIKKYLRPGAEWAILVISVAGEEGKKKKGMRSGRKGREERSVLQTAVFGAQRSVYHVILKLILWLLQFLTQWEFWQSEAT